MPKLRNPVVRNWTPEQAKDIRAAVERLYGPGGSLAAVLSEVPRAEDVERFRVDRLWLEAMIDSAALVPYVPTPRRKREPEGGACALTSC